VFESDNDVSAYLATACGLRTIGFQVYDYCLMSTHAHLIVRWNRFDLRSVQHVIDRLSVHFYDRGANARRNPRRLRSDEYTWWNPIESDSYLLTCTRYLHLNPVRASIVSHPEHYFWSSYRARIGLEPCSWLDTDPCFLDLGATDDVRERRYREFVERGVPNLQLAVLDSLIS
jgi:putative transposase